MLEHANWTHPADLICAVMKRIYDRDLTTMTGGNLSLLDAQGHLWVSPSNVDKGSLTRDDVVCVRQDGSLEGRRRPTSEYRIHQRIFRSNPDYRAVLHAHPPAVVTLSVLHELPDTNLTVAAHEAASEVGLVEYALGGTPKLVEYVGEVFDRGYSTAILKNHATILASRVDLLDAYRRLEQLDHTANLQLNTAAIGTPRSLSPAQVRAYASSIRTYEGLAMPVPSGAELALRRTLADTAQRAYGKRLFTGMFGSISARGEEGSILISPRKADNACVSAGDFVRVEGSRCELGKIPDDTAELHQAIYAHDPDVHSVIVAAPVHATSFAVCDREFDVTLIPESYGVLRSWARIPFSALLERRSSIGSLVDSRHPFGIIGNLGIVLAGSSPLQALDRLEVAESTAISIHLAWRSERTILSLTREQQAEVDNQ